MQLDRRKADMRDRRQSQSERVPVDFGVLWELTNARRAKFKLPPLRPPRAFRARYSGADLRAIRARKVNFKGEPQR